jgi:hypothetical protein
MMSIDCKDVSESMAVYSSLAYNLFDMCTSLLSLFCQAVSVHLFASNVPFCGHWHVLITDLGVFTGSSNVSSAAGVSTV